MIVENEQYGSKQSFYHLEVCCRLVGEKIGNPGFGSWTNRDYIRLSSILSRETDVQISPSTLKRIFGKLKTSERYFPQKATRDALARFSGFKDWDVLVSKYPKPAVIEELGVPQQAGNSPNTIEPAPVSPSRKARQKHVAVYILLGLAVALFLLWMLIGGSNSEAVNFGGVKLICPNPEGENPHSASFRIELPKNFNGDSSNFTVHFGDGRREKRIGPSQLVTHYYEAPGRFHAVLKYGDETVDTVALYLKTTDWTATSFMERDTTRVYPINSNWFLEKGRLRVNTVDLQRAGVDTNKTFFVSFINSKPLGINGDNFELQTNVTTSEVRPGVRCSQVTLEVFGERTNHEVMLIKPGCVSWAYLRFSELHKDGGTEDLSALGTDLTSGGDIRLNVLNKVVRLFINNKLAYQSAYEVPLKKLYGVKISFSGIGSVNSLHLRDLISGQELKDGSFD